MQLIPVITTMAVLLFESILDIRSMKTYTMPIYAVCVINIAIKSVYEIRCGVWVRLVYVYLFVIIFGICCYCASYLVHRKVGAGDFDIIFLIFITQPVFAVILMISILVMFVYECIVNLARKNNTKDILQEQRALTGILSVKIPFVPFLLAGYIISVILTGVIL